MFMLQCVELHIMYVATATCMTSLGEHCSFAGI